VLGGVGLVSACNTHPVSLSRAIAEVEFQQITSVDESTNLDILWVIDNSGSMCQEQATLRNNFESFVEELNKTSLDFHIGVTTTDMNPDYPLEPVASPGRLQSTPQPVPGFDRSCHKAVDEDGVAIAGNYQPIKDSIQAAVDCMDVPDSSFTMVSNADIECALYATPAGCSIARAGCGGAAACTAEDLFPDPSQYRAIPKVLRSRDYITDSVLDVDGLKADFACMSLVGTRGYGIEKGLSAAVEAVKLENTGGVVGGPSADVSAPNHGLIRPDARFAVVFVTDENDCSHDGTLDEGSACGSDVCAFANKPGVDSPLVEPAMLKAELMEHLQLTKGETFTDQDVLVASIHGNYKTFDGAIPTEEECRAPGYESVPPACATANGIAFSGDRYERFMTEFQNHYPKIGEGSDHAQGWMCSTTFQPALKAIGEFFSTAPGGCITRPIYPCQADSECPAFPFTSQAGTCVSRPNSSQNYCDSALQVRAVAADLAGVEMLRVSGYCIEESVGSQGLATGCVVDNSKFSFTQCDGGVSGVRLNWGNPIEARTALAGTDIVLRYHSIVSEGY
jgi:hypothetical protein